MANSNTMHTTRITPGQTYMTETGIPVTAIRKFAGNRALFVSEEYYPEPFISCNYELPPPSQPCYISLSNIQTYPSLDVAFRAEAINAGPVGLKLSYYCPNCDKVYEQEIDLDGSAHSVISDIDDFRVMCSNCGHMWMGITKLSVVDDDNSYELPLWHGPILSEQNTDL